MLGRSGINPSLIDGSSDRSSLANSDSDLSRISLTLIGKLSSNCWASGS